MFSPTAVLLAILVYMGLLYVVARMATRYPEWVTGSPLVYSLSLAVFCTSWTFFGGVGAATHSGMILLTIYLGPTLAMILGQRIIGRMVRIRKTHRITSIADFLSTRYNKSNTVAALATLVALLGVLPYLALQIRSVVATFGIIVQTGNADPWFSGNAIGFLVVALMIAFTIVFGVRRLAPDEQHPGIVAMVAVESVVKLTAFLALGLLVTSAFPGGLTGILDRFSQIPYYADWQSQNAAISPLTWFSYLLLSMSAVLFLPRQFHVAVVENANEDHIRTAAWMFPLYLLGITLFVLPLAFAALMFGLPTSQSDTFVLRLPLSMDRPGMALLVFLGGFSAATSMIMIESMTLATMITNHLLLPVFAAAKSLSALRGRILHFRWLSVALVILLGFAIERLMAGRFHLIEFGIIAFAAIFQFAPPLLLGLFSRKGTAAACCAGLLAGFSVWLYTMALPALIKSGWIAVSLLDHGPFGWILLKPEALFGLAGLHPVAHTVFWSLLANLGAYFLVMIFAPNGQDNRQQVDDFLAAAEFAPLQGATLEPFIDLKPKLLTMFSLLKEYFSLSQSGRMLRRARLEAGLKNRSKANIVDYACLFSQVEKTLAAAIGSAPAHAAMRRAKLFSSAEEKALSLASSDLLATWKLSPEDLAKKIDFQLEKERLLTCHAQELKAQIREREQAQTQLGQEKERLAVALRSIGDGVITTDSSGAILFMNRAAEDLTGWTVGEATGKNLTDVYRLVSDNFEPFESPLNRLGRHESLTLNLSQTWLIDREGRRKLINEGCAPLLGPNNAIIGIILTFRDLTDRQRLAEESIKAEKLESLGLLAGGIAHDFNNILTAILGNITFAKLSVDQEGRVFQKLSEAENATFKAKDLTQQLLTFSRGGAPLREAFSIRDVVKESAQFALRGSNVRCDFVFPDGLWTAVADPGQISQVIHNLVLNACQAMPKGGVVTISAENITISPGSPKPLKAGPYIRISVTDRGTGIAKEKLEKIFTPYFTTKPSGTGLGLTTSRAIITNHGGLLEAESEISQGSTFSFFLPASAQQMMVQPPSREADLKGHGKILVMDDDELIREISYDLLIHLGYEPATAKDGEEAIALFQKAREATSPFDAAILDLTVPGGMGGKETVRELLKIDPMAKIIVSSGYATDPVLTHYQHHGFQGVLVKPYKIEQLNAVLLEILGRKA